MYFCYTEDDNLLYVGKSGSTMCRFSQHSSGSKFWSLVDYVKIKHYPSERKQISAERKYIEELQPRYNVTFTRYDEAHRENQRRDAAILRAVRDAAQIKICEEKDAQKKVEEVQAAKWNLGATEARVKGYHVFGRVRTGITNPDGSYTLHVPITVPGDALRDFVVTRGASEKYKKDDLVSMALSIALDDSAVAAAALISVVDTLPVEYGALARLIVGELEKTPLKASELRERFDDDEYEQSKIVACLRMLNENGLVEPDEKYTGNGAIWSLKARYA